MPDEANCCAPTRSLICLAMVKNACSTFTEFLADVSKKGIPSLSANSYIESWVGTNDSQRDIKYLCCGILNLALSCHIGFVSNQQLIYAFTGVSVNLLQPALNIVERIRISDIIDDNDAVSTAIIAAGDSPKTLLSGGIPLVISSRHPLGSHRTICNLTVLPSKSTVRIFFTY